MKTKKLYLYLFALIANITIVWAGASSFPAIGATLANAFESGKQASTSLYESGAEVQSTEVYNAEEAILPTFASQASPAWHHVKFNNSGNAICDQGAGKNVTIGTATESDAYMWNIVGSKEAFYMVSKPGNYLAYDATSNRYTTTSDKSKKAAFTLTEGNTGCWEIVRKGSDKSMSQAEQNYIENLNTFLYIVPLKKKKLARIS